MTDIVNGSPVSTVEATGRTYTAREVVVMQREAVVRAMDAYGAPRAVEVARNIARDMLPLPPITRERVLRFGDVEFRVRSGEIQSRIFGGRRPFSKSPYNPVMVTLLHDLIQKPTETVPDEETDGEEQDRR